MILAANLSWLFTERPLPERPAAAARAGFEAVEVLFPYDIPAADLRGAVEASGLALALINTPPGDTMGQAAMPGEEAAFRRNFARAASYARDAGSPALHVMSGKTQDPAARDTLVANLRWAAGEAPDLKLTVEPLNPSDVPGYFVNDFMLAAAIVADCDLPNVRLQFDAYHAAMIHGDACEVWRAVGQLDGHVQIASAPGRGEPDATTLEVLSLLKDQGYNGCVSAEYKPAGRTEDGLDWLDAAKEIAAR